MVFHLFERKNWIFGHSFLTRKKIVSPRYHPGICNASNATAPQEHLQLPILLTPSRRDRDSGRENVPDPRQKGNETQRDIPKFTSGHGRGPQAETGQHHTKKTSGVRESETHIGGDGLGLSKNSIGEMQQHGRKYTSDRGVPRKYCGETPLAQTEQWGDRCAGPGAQRERGVQRRRRQCSRRSSNSECPRFEWQRSDWCSFRYR